MQYRLQPLALRRIWSFYRNVSLKYSHTYSLEDMHRNVRFAIDSCYLIEKTLARRRPILKNGMDASWQKRVNGFMPM